MYVYIYIYLVNQQKALGHPQKSTPVKTDNATVASFVTDMLKQKRSKSWESGTIGSANNRH